MDSGDSSLIDIGHEDDTLLRNLSPDDTEAFTCSPFVIAGSAASSRSRPHPPKTTMTRDITRFGETGCIMPDSDKENLSVSGTMKLGSSNLNLEPQRMKRSRKAGGCNLRKSLAWDKAFFTEEGVLSSVELSMISGTPCKLGGRDLSVICEEPKTPMHTNSTRTGFHNIDSKSFRKLPSSSTRGNKRIGEGSILKQKSPALASLKSKKPASTASASNSGRKDGSCFKNLAPSSSHKRLLSTSPAKPAAQKTKIPRMPVLKPVGHLISTTANSSDASHLKHNQSVPPAPSVQKQLGQKGSSNKRGTSNAPKIVSQRIPKPSKSSDQRTRKNRTDSGSREQSSTSHQVSNLKEITFSEVNSGKILPVGLAANDGTSKAAVLVHANSGNLCTIGHPVQHQAAKPSGLRMPSPSLRYFSEPKISMKNGLGQRNIQPSNLPNSGIAGSRNLGATCNILQSKFPKATTDRIPDSGPVQPCSISSISHTPGAKWNVVQSKIPKATMDTVPDSGPVQPCSVSSINSPKIHNESVHRKSIELSVAVQTLLGEKPSVQISNNGFEEVDKHFVEYEHTTLSIEGADGKDNGSVSPIGEGKYNDTELLQSSGGQLIPHGLNKISDCHVMQGQYDSSVMNKGLGLESEVQEYDIAHPPPGDDCCVEPNGINWNEELQELQCPSYAMDQVPQVYGRLSSNIEEQLKRSSFRSFSPERAFENDIVNSVMTEDKVDKLLVAREALSASIEKIVDMSNEQQELKVLLCPLPLMDKPVQRADRSTVEDYGFRIVTDEDKLSDYLPLDAALSASLDTKPQAEDCVDPCVAECSNGTDLVGQNTHFEIQMSPRACKSISQVDAAICDAELSFSPSQGLGSTVAQLSTDGIDQHHKDFDELLREPLMSDKVTSASLKNKHSSDDLITSEDRKLRHKAELQLSPSTISAEPLMPDEATSGSLENQHLKDLVSIDGRELSFQVEFQLNSNTCEDHTMHAAAVCTLEGQSLVNETMSDSLGKDMCEIDLVMHDGRELIDNSCMETLLLPNKHENQTANSPDINNTRSYSPHGRVDLSLPLKASRDSTIAVDKLETDHLMKQEPQNYSVEIDQVENHIVLIDSPSGNDCRSDQTILKELQLSPRTSEDCTRSSGANCDIKVSSSPCQLKSSTVNNTSKDESDEQFESANQHQVFHDIDNQDAKIRSKILKDGKNLSQLVIRPPADVAPFSDEWVAAVEAAGEEILTLKTGPVQNSPPARLSPEPGPWSPVKRKNNQGIGPYDCTKYTGGQH